jgi:hypothetical protein
LRTAATGGKQCRAQACGNCQSNTAPQFHSYRHFSILFNGFAMPCGKRRHAASNTNAQYMERAGIVNLLMVCEQKTAHRKWAKWMPLAGGNVLMRIKSE